MNNEIDIADIRKIIDSWALAIKEEDIDKVIENHSEDIIIYDVPEPLQSKGLMEYKKIWYSYFNFSKRSGVFDIIELKITASSTVAFCCGILKCAGKAANGNDISYISRLTIGLEKTNGPWTITHEHLSLPSAMHIS